MENLQQFGQMLQTMLPKSGDGRIMASPINPMAIQVEYSQSICVLPANFRVQAQLRQMNPELTHEDLVARTRAAIMQLQNMHRSAEDQHPAVLMFVLRTQTPVIVNKNTLNIGQRQTTGYDQSFYQAEMAKAKAMIQHQYPGMYRSDQTNFLPSFYRCADDSLPCSGSEAPRPQACNQALRTSLPMPKTCRNSARR